MRHVSIMILLIFVGCHTCPIATTPRQKRLSQTRKRPQDMTDRILPDKKYPDWLKKNYAQWIRYAYDLEEPSSLHK